MDKLFCLVGKSNTGKDTLARELLARPELALSSLVLYTTRPRRPNEAEGKDYHFVTTEAMDALIHERGLIERRDYHTALGLWSYCTLPETAAAPGHRLAVTPLPALPAYYKHFGRDRVIPFYIESPDRERLNRAIARESQSDTPCYAEVCRRYLTDEQDFSREKLLECGITRAFLNIDFNDCLLDLIHEIAHCAGSGDSGGTDLPPVL